jgi:predicted nucleotidyltransferase
MAHTQTTAKLDEIERLVAQIVAKFHPHKIILFGSHAYGEPTADSDVDLLVVMETDENPLRTAGRISAAIDHPFALDILVMRPGDLAASFQRRGNFAMEVMTRGLVLHEARDR